MNKSTVAPTTPTIAQRLARQQADQYRKDIEELLPQLAKTLNVVPQSAGLFLPATLTADGLTDMQKLNIPHLATLGRQINNDFTTIIKPQADALGVKMHEFINRVAGLTEINPEQQSILLVDAIGINEEYRQWSDTFARLIVAALQDAIDLINAARPETSQIKPVLVKGTPDVK